MTTKFGSFDASPLGALVESPLGARNRSIEEAIQSVLIMVWSGKDTFYDGPQGGANYLSDIAAWDRLLDRHDEDDVPVVAAAVEVTQFPIVPRGFAPPRRVVITSNPFLTFGRPFPVDEHIALFESLRGSLQPEFILLRVDQFSVGIANLQPGWDSFVGSVAALSPDASVSAREYGGRWVRILSS